MTTEQGSPLASWPRERLEDLVMFFVAALHHGDANCAYTADSLYPELFPNDDEDDDQ